MPTIEISNLCKRYGKTTALDGVTMTVGEGEIFGIIGPDGAGKSTLIRCLTTLEKPDSGDASVCGYDIRRGYRSIRQSIGYMPELFSLYPDLTVWENMTFYASLFNVDIEQNFATIEPVFRQLEPFRNRMAGKLSGGMKQKLALSCALIHQPHLLLLDEPTRGVDPVSRKDFWDILNDIKKDGISILLTTSYMDEAELCDTVGLMNHGRLMLHGSPAAVADQYPCTLYALRGDNLYSLLLEVRHSGYAIDCYTFGDCIHAVFQDEASAGKLISTLDGVQTERIRPTIEDCFMNLIANEQHN